MKQITIYLIFIFAMNVVFGQVNDSLPEKIKHEVSIDLCGVNTHILNYNFFGVNDDFLYYPKGRYGTGTSFSWVGKQIADTFEYSIGQPVIDYYEIGWINQYDFVQQDRIRINVNLNNGMAMFRLGDKDIKEKYRTKYGYSYRPKEIATNYFYLIEPGFTVSLRLFSNNHFPDIYMTTKAKYRFLIGNSKYGTINQFSNYIIAFGVSFIGFTDDK